jgi:hypothetical protein
MFIYSTYQSFDLNRHFVVMCDCCLMPNEQYFSYIMVITSLYKTNTLNWIVRSLACRNKSTRVEFPLHSNTLSWFRYNQSLLLLLKPACLTEKQQLPIIQGPLWSWSYGSWVCNYLRNQCLSPLKLWVRTPYMARCTRYNIKW